MIFFTIFYDWVPKSRDIVANAKNHTTDGKLWNVTIRATILHSLVKKVLHNIPLCKLSVLSQVIDELAQ